MSDAAAAMTDDTLSPAAGETGADVRHAACAGFTGTTVGRAPGFLQANLFVVEARHAGDFAAFCDANPAACPLLGRSTPGRWDIPALGRDMDLRTDLPGYLIHRDGAPRAAGHLADVWRPDFVAFAIGCWLSAEGALARAGIRMRHLEQGVQGGLYRTGRAAVPAGALSGPLVVSMRPFRTADMPRVKAITARLPRSHGAPIHDGAPDGLGIADLARPDWGDAVIPDAGERALYWPCGLTALAALQASRVPLFISHAPGAMLVTDLQEGPLP